MITTFIYKGAIIETPNLEKKLKRMKLTVQDIQIIPNREVKQIDEIPDIDENIILYKWINKRNNNIHVSINNTLDDMKSVSGFIVDDWEYIN